MGSPITNNAAGLLFLEVYEGDPSLARAAACNIGYMLQMGWLNPEDYGASDKSRASVDRASRKWYEAAAQRGDAEAAVWATELLFRDPWIDAREKLASAKALLSTGRGGTRAAAWLHLITEAEAKNHQVPVVPPTDAADDLTSELSRL